MTSIAELVVARFSNLPHTSQDGDDVISAVTPKKIRFNIEDDCVFFVTEDGDYVSEAIDEVVSDLTPLGFKVSRTDTVLTISK
jgi:hypothetical protein